MKKLVLLLFGLSVFAACEKPEGFDDPIDASKDRLLQDGKWQLKAYTLNEDINDPLVFPRDRYSDLPGCRTDDYFIFAAPTFTRYENWDKCGQDDPDMIEYYYSLENDENYLRVWAVADDPANSVVMQGDLRYPGVDTFILTYQEFDEATELTSEHIQTYVKMR